MMNDDEFAGMKRRKKGGRHLLLIGQSYLYLGHRTHAELERSCSSSPKEGTLDSYLLLLYSRGQKLWCLHFTRCNCFTLLPKTSIAFGSVNSQGGKSWRFPLLQILCKTTHIGNTNVERQERRTALNHFVTQSCSVCGCDCEAGGQLLIAQGKTTTIIWYRCNSIGSSSLTSDHKPDQNHSAMGR